MARAVRVLMASAALLAGLSGSARASSAATRVVRLDLETAIQPLSASYLSDGIRRAEREASAVLLRIDTPGGLDRSMRSVAGTILGSKVPVICWVGPSGARAASAGTFVLLACNWATMAPGTSVGAAKPVGISGEVLATKVTNDAAAFIRSIAEVRGRNADWAERAVRESAAVSARQALDLDVIDAVARTPEEALRSADGRDTPDGAIETWPATITQDPMPLGRRLVGSIVDPNLAFLLLVVGLAGIAFEVLHPGLSVPGVGGLLALVLGLVTLQMLPVRLAGLGLIVAGLIFFVLEAYAPGFGVPGAAGVASLLLGGLLLFDARTLVQVSRALVVGVVAATGLLFLTVVRSTRSARRMPATGRTLLGAEGVSVTDLNPSGTVRVRSEEWSAETLTEPIAAGTRIVVMEKDGLRLKVTKL